MMTQSSYYRYKRNYWLVSKIRSPLPQVYRTIFSVTPYEQLTTVATWFIIFDSKSHKCHLIYNNYQTLLCLV